MADEPVFDCMGRVNLAPPSDESLIAAAEDCLGDRADETMLPDGSKLFRSQTAPGLYFVAPPGDPVGILLAAAPSETKSVLMSEAAKVRAVRDDEERQRYLDPATNPMIRTK